MRKQAKNTPAKDDAAKTPQASNSKWRKSGDGKTYTDKDTGKYYIAKPVEGDESYSVTVLGSPDGPVLYALRVQDDADLDRLIDA